VSDTVIAGDVAVHTREQLRYASVSERLTLSLSSASRPEIQCVNVTGALSGSFGVSITGLKVMSAAIPVDASASDFKDKLFEKFDNISSCYKWDIDVSRTTVRCARARRVPLLLSAATWRRPWRLVRADHWRLLVVHHVPLSRCSAVPSAGAQQPGCDLRQRRR
jgi:hypothetical protein